MITQEPLLNKSKFLTKEEQSLLSQGRLKRETAIKLCGATTHAPPDALISIMEKFDMMIPVKVEDPTQAEGTQASVSTQAGKVLIEEYLVPCLLKRIPEQRVRASRKNESTLHFRFLHRDSINEDLPCSFLPHGLFHRLISRCHRTKKLAPGRKEIYYDYMEFGGENCVFSLHMAHAYGSIMLDVFHFATECTAEDQRREVRSFLREEIQAMIDDITQDLFPNLACVHCLECPSETHKNRDTIRLGHRARSL